MSINIVRCPKLPFLSRFAQITYTSNWQTTNYSIPLPRDPYNGDFTVQNCALWNADDDGQIVGAIYWQPGFVDDFSDLSTNTDPVEWINLNVEKYPNPFTGSANFSFFLDEKADVTIELYDIIGKKVAELFHDQMSNGQQSLEIKTSSLNPGMYVFRLITNGATSTGSRV